MPRWKVTSATSDFLARAKAVFNAPIYRECLRIVNEQGEDAARGYLQTYVKGSVEILLNNTYQINPNAAERRRISRETAEEIIRNADPRHVWAVYEKEFGYVKSTGMTYIGAGNFLIMECGAAEAVRLIRAEQAAEVSRIEAARDRADAEMRRDNN